MISFFILVSFYVGDAFSEIESYVKPEGPYGRIRATLISVDISGAEAFFGVGVFHVLTDDPKIPADQRNIDSLDKAQVFHQTGGQRITERYFTEFYVTAIVHVARPRAVHIPEGSLGASVYVGRADIIGASVFLHSGKHTSAPFRHRQAHIETVGVHPDRFLIQAGCLSIPLVKGEDIASVADVNHKIQ